MYTFSNCEADFAVQRKAFNETVFTDKADLCVAGVGAVTEANLPALATISDLQSGQHLSGLCAVEPFRSLLKWETAQ